MDGRLEVNANSLFCKVGFINNQKKVTIQKKKNLLKIINVFFEYQVSIHSRNGLAPGRMVTKLWHTRCIQVFM